MKKKGNIEKNIVFCTKFILFLIALFIICFIFIVSKKEYKQKLEQTKVEYFYQDIESLNLRGDFNRNRFLTIQEVVKDLKDKNYVIYEVKDVIINNPQGEPNYTITTIINNEVKFLYVGKKSGHPNMGLVYFKLNDSNGLNYIDSLSEEGYSQYIKIYKNEDELYEYDLQKYLIFPCELYIKNLTPGENPNGKFAPIKAGKIGE